MKKILTLDDFYFPHDENIRSVMATPEWYWENILDTSVYQSGAKVFSVVPSPQGGYDMFLAAYTPGEPFGHHGYTTVLAHSDDGFHFSPEREIGPYLAHGTSIAVYRDEQDERYPYKGIESDVFRYAPDGTRTGCDPSYCLGSADGVHWQRMSENQVIPHCTVDCFPSMLYNPYTGKYQATLRVSHGDRRISMVESDDCITWTKPRCILHPGTPLDGPNTHYYSMPQFYSPSMDIFIGFLWKLHMPYDALSEGPMTTELVYSYDGHHWNRTLHTLMAVNHPLCQADYAPANAPRAKGWVMGMIEREDDILLYANGSDYEHKRGKITTFPMDRTHVGRLRKDGFAYYQAGERIGCACTLNLKAREDTRLFLNYRTRNQGFVKAAIHSSGGGLIPGFTMEDCLLPTGDHTHMEMRWKGGTWADIAAEYPWVKLHFRLKTADLFSLTGDFYALVNSSGVLYDRP